MAAKKKVVTKATKRPTKKTVKAKKPTKKLAELGVMDIAFIIDATGSMMPYIQEAKDRVAEILKKIQKDADLDIKVALIAYRDHPPQDHSFVTQAADFDTIDKADKTLAPLMASGGGDHPESVFDGIHELANLSWRDKSERLAFLIGDAPPHDPCICGITPKQLIKELKQFKIKLSAHSIAGEAVTTTAFKQFVDATGGDISTGNSPTYTTALYGGTVGTSAGAIGTTRAFVSAYATTSGSYTSAATLDWATAVNAGKSVGMSEEEVAVTVNYLKARDL